MGQSLQSAFNVTWRHRSHTGGALAFLFLLIGLSLISTDIQTTTSLTGQAGVAALIIAAIFTVGHGIMRRMDTLIHLLDESGEHSGD